jgi:hypothetical protein
MNSLAVKRGAMQVRVAARNHNGSGSRSLLQSSSSSRAATQQFSPKVACYSSTMGPLWPPNNDEGDSWFQGTETPNMAAWEGKDKPFVKPQEPGSRAFVECDRDAVIDLFHQYAVDCDVSGTHLDMKGLEAVLRSVGENPSPQEVENLFRAADMGKNNLIDLEVSYCFLHTCSVCMRMMDCSLILISIFNFVL